jgi:hypothetical protein
VEHSLFLAKLMGIVLVVGPIVKTVRHKQFVIACARSVWAADWRVAITLLGWLMLSVSLLQLFFPRSMAWPMQVLPEAKYRIVLDVAQLLLGVYLVYHGFRG